MNLRKKQKIFLTFLLTFLSSVLFAFFPSLPRFLCIIAVLFSNSGDLILMNCKTVTKHLKGDLFLFGIEAFGISQLFYILLFSVKALKLDVKINIGTFISSAAFAVLILFIILFAIKSKFIDLKLAFIGLLYIFVFAFNLCILSTLACEGGIDSVTALIGGFLFFISDMLIAKSRIQNKSVKDIYIWTSYICGQILLIAGV